MFNANTFYAARIFKYENLSYYKEAWLVDKARKRLCFVTVVYVDKDRRQ